MRGPASFSNLLVLLALAVAGQPSGVSAQSPAGNFDDVLTVGRPSITGSSPSIPAGTVFDNDRVDVFDTFVPSMVRIGDNVRLTNRSELNLFDGVSGENIVLEDSDANFLGGRVGDGFGIRGDSTVNVFETGPGDSLAIGELAQIFAGATLNLSGGNIGADFGVNPGATVNVSGGLIQPGFTTISEGAGSDPAVVNFSGGGLGSGATANQGGVFNVLGGEYTAEIGAGRFSANNGAKINVSGGRFGPISFDQGIGARLLTANQGSVVNISGGEFLPSRAAGDPARLIANGGSEVNLVGSEFRLDGVLLDLLATDQPLTIPDRGVVLSGVLNDGSPFSFDLNTDPFSETASDIIAADAIVTVTLSIPEPATLTFLMLGLGGMAARRP